MAQTGKLLITGCAGYVGSAFLREAIKEGYDIRCVDRLIYGGDHIAGLIAAPNVEFIFGDIRDEKIRKEILKDVDKVVHLAAIVGDLPCQVAPKLSVQINFQATKNLALDAKKVGIKKFIFASTCSNYGITDSENLANEESPLNPVSLYAETKIDCERFLQSIADDNFHPVLLRFGTAHGMSFRTRFDLTVNSFAYEAIKNNELVVFGAEQWRPFIHVSDMARIMIKALTLPDKEVSGQIFNAGCNSENYTKRDMVRLLKELMPDLKTKFVVKEEDKRSYRVDFSKLEKTFKYVPSKRVKDGFREMISAFKAGILNSNHYHANKLEALEEFYAELEKKES